MVFQARKVALVPLSNTKSTIFTYIVGTDIQEVLYGAERERVEDLESCSTEDWSDVVASPGMLAATRS